MIKKDRGKIIIISSMAGIIPIPFLGVYSSTKSSINALSTCLRDELSLISNNIQIKLIQPGFYHTGFNQVMFDNKDDYMNIDSYFSKILNEINSVEGSLISFLEKKNLMSIVNKILLAIKTNDNKFIYRAPISHAIFVKFYNFFKG